MIFKEKKVNKVLVTGLAIGKDLDVCEVCNLDFDWVLNEKNENGSIFCTPNPEEGLGVFVWGGIIKQRKGDGEERFK